MTAPSDDDRGTRAIRLEVEVPGTPEQVWDAIATGSGISAWFVPAEVDEREGGAVVMHDIAPGIDETGRVTAWEPPHRFVYEAPEGGERRLAFEWLVEARSGGSCVVRLVNSGFGTGADWDAEYDGMESGWRLFLENLRLYLTHFAGQRSRAIIVGGLASQPQSRAWSAMLSALGLSVTSVGDPVSAGAADAPPLAGIVERVSDGMVTLLLSEPAPGIAFLAVEGMGDEVAVSLYTYLFGDGVDDVVARDEPRWREWMQRHLPAADSAPAPR